MNDLSNDDIFAENGLLAEKLSGYVVREPQRILSQAISDSLNKKNILVAEAATGTGKTFAYLVPVLVSDKKVIISTGTKHLQDQLFKGDLPRVLNALSLVKTTAYLKGRANYICHHRLELSLEQGLFFSPDTMKQLQLIKSILPRLKEGDKGEIKEIGEDSEAWNYATSTVDNCLGSDCNFFDKCFIQRARKKAQKASVLVINHHLFFADTLLKDEGFAEILPAVDTIVFDEAHQLPEVASHFFGKSLSTRQLAVLCDDIAIHQTALPNDMPALTDAVVQTQRGLEALKSILPKSGRFSFIALNQQTGFQQKLTILTEALAELKKQLEIVLERSKELMQCFERVYDFCSILSSFSEPLVAKNNALWVACFKRSAIFHCTSLDIASSFSQIVNADKKSYIFTSATLAVGRELNHFINRLGLPKTKSLVVDSSYDYQKQAMLYFPRGLTDPNAVGFIERLLIKSLPLIECLKGRTLFLFTSYKALYEARDWFLSQTSFDLLVQGEKEKSYLLAEFRANSHNRVLLATSSFWEGVDIKGQALSLLIIDKLPFESPSDPLLNARLKAIRDKGGDPFYDYQLPQAIITLKQGVGRLIRDSEDKGIILIADPRVYTREYSHLILKSLPQMKKTRCLESVLKFADTLN